MANCPNCGSSGIQKSDRTTWVFDTSTKFMTECADNSCLGCGETWNPKILYSNIKLIEELTDITLDLSQKKHRSFRDKFNTEMKPYINSVTFSDSKAESMVKKAVEEREVNAQTGAGCGCLFTLILIFFFHSFLTSIPWGWALFLVFGPFIIGTFAGMYRDAENAACLQPKILESQRKAEEMMERSREELRAKAKEVKEKYFNE